MEEYVFVAGGFELATFEAENIDDVDIYDYIYENEEEIAEMGEYVEVYFRDAYGNAFQCTEVHNEEDDEEDEED